MKITYLGPAFGDTDQEEDQNSGFLGDLGTAIKQGFTTDLARTATGLADLGGAALGADTSLTAMADKAGLAEIDRGYYNELTPETQEQLRNIENADGFFGTLAAGIANPRGTAYNIARTFAPMATGVGAGAVAGRLIGAVGSRVLTRQAVKTLGKTEKADLLKKTANQLRDKYIQGSMAAGEGIVGAGSSAAQIAQYNAEHPESRDPLEGVGWAGATGALTGAIAYGAGRLGGSIESAIGNKAVRNALSENTAALPRRIALGQIGKSALTEGLEELAQAPGETIPQNIATNQPWDEGLGSNMAQSLIAGSALGGAARGAIYGADRLHRWATPGESRPPVQQETPDLGQAQGAVGDLVDQPGVAPAQEAATTQEAPPAGDEYSALLNAAAQRAQARAEEEAQAKTDAELEKQALKDQKEQEKLARQQAKEEEKQRKAAEKQAAAEAKVEKEQVFKLAENAYRQTFRATAGEKVSPKAVNRYNEQVNSAPWYQKVAKTVDDLAQTEDSKVIGSHDRRANLMDTLYSLVEHPKNAETGAIEMDSRTEADIADALDTLAENQRKKRTAEAEEVADIYEMLASRLRGESTDRQSFYMKKFDDFNKQSKPRQALTAEKMLDAKKPVKNAPNVSLTIDDNGTKRTFQGSVVNGRFTPDRAQMRMLAKANGYTKPKDVSAFINDYAQKFPVVAKPKTASGEKQTAQVQPAETVATETPVETVKAAKPAKKAAAKTENPAKELLRRYLKQTKRSGDAMMRELSQEDKTRFEAYLDVLEADAKGRSEFEASLPTRQRPKFRKMMEGRNASNATPAAETPIKATKKKKPSKEEDAKPEPAPVETPAEPESELYEDDSKDVPAKEPEPQHAKGVQLLRRILRHKTSDGKAEEFTSMKPDEQEEVRGIVEKVFSIRAKDFVPYFNKRETKELGKLSKEAFYMNAKEKEATAGMAQRVGSETGEINVKSQVDEDDAADVTSTITGDTTPESNVGMGGTLADAEVLATDEEAVGTGAKAENVGKNYMYRDLLYKPLLSAPFNQPKGGKRLIEMDTRHGKVTPAGIEALSNELSSNEEARTLVRDVLTSSDAVDLMVNLVSAKPTPTRLNALEDFHGAYLDLADKAGVKSEDIQLADHILLGGILEFQKKLGKATAATHNEVSLAPTESTIKEDSAKAARGNLTREASRLVRSATGADVEAIDIDALNAITANAKTEVGKAAVNNGMYVVTKYGQGVAIPVKDVLASENPEVDFKGVFSDRFIKGVIPALKAWVAKGYAIDEGMLLVDRTEPLFKLVNDTTNYQKTRGSYVSLGEDSRMFALSLDGNLSPSIRGESPKLLTFMYGAPEGTVAFEDTLPFHELTHAAVDGNKELLDWTVKQLQEGAAKEALALVDRVANGSDTTLDANLRKAVEHELLYPFTAAKKLNAPLARQQEVAADEMTSALVSLCERYPEFLKMLESSNEFPKLLNIYRRVQQNVDTSSNEHGRSNRHNQEARSGDRVRLEEVGARPDGGRREDDGRVHGEAAGLGEGTSGEPVGRSGSGNEDGRRPASEEVRRAYGRVQEEGRRFLRTHPGIRKALGNLGGLVFKGALGGLFTKDVISLAYKATGIKAFKDYGDTWGQLDSRRNAYLKDPSRIYKKYSSLSQADKDKANAYINEAVISGHWGFVRGNHAFKTAKEFSDFVEGKQASFIKAENAAKAKGAANATENWVAKEEEMGRKFNALPPAVQDVVRSVFNNGVDTLDTQLRILKEQMYPLVQKALNAAESKEEVDAALDEFNTKVKDIEKRYTELRNSPYCPLIRTGSHAVVVKSASLIDTGTRLRALSDKLAKEKNPSEDDKKLLKTLRSTMDAMESNGKDYIVEFVDGEGSAAVRADELHKAYPDAQVDYFERMANDGTQLPQYATIERVLNMVASRNAEGEAESTSITQLKAILDDMYIKSLHDDAAKKRDLHRRKVGGYNANMLENFMHAAPATANRIAFMEMLPQIHKVSHQMDYEIRNIRDLHGATAADARSKASVYRNELVKRQEAMARPTSKTVGNVMRATSFGMLMTNPSYYIMNATQPFMLSAPFMAGRFGLKSFKQLGDNMIAVYRLMKADPDFEKLEEVMNDPKIKPEDKPMTMDEFKALDHSRRNGNIDIGITQEFGDVSIGDRSGKAIKTAAEVSEKLTNVARRLEMLNRVATFLTAYRLEFARTKSKEKAREYADSVIYETHGNYSAFNAPRYFNANWVTKLATQFRKFQLIQAGEMIRMVSGAFRDADPEVRAEARRKLAWTMGVHLALTGAKGAPFVGLILGAMAGAFGDDGDDAEDWIRKMINDKSVSDVLLEGLPSMAGVDVSGRLGAGQMLSPFPYVSTDAKTNREAMLEYMLAILGPAGSLVARGATAKDYFAQGDYYKATEQVAPSFLTNVMKTYRLFTEGYTSKAGDVLVKPEDYDMSDAALQLFGFQPKTISDRGRIQGSLLRHQEAFESEKTRIYMDFKKARRERDAAGMAAARRELADLSKRSQAQGLKRYTYKDMLSAARAQSKRERNAIGGVASTKSNRRFLEEASKR